MWDHACPSSVRELQPSFPEAAYTTLMTTLDRLHRKGLLDRSKRGRAFFYQPRLTRAEFASDRAAKALRTALEGGGDMVPLLSFFVEAIGEQDPHLLDGLEALVRARRATVDRKHS